MPEALTEARWAAIRAVCEGALPTHERVAEAAGVYVKTISRRAGEEQWKALDFRYKRVGAAHRAMIELAAMARAGEELDPVDAPDEGSGDAAGAASDGLPALAGPDAAAELAALAELPPDERIARIGAALTRRTEAILQRVEAGLPVESRQVAALSTLVQLSERIAVLAREDVKKQAIKSDDELAAMLEKIDDRIVELAEGYAQQILVKRGLSEAEAEAAMGE